MTFRTYRAVGNLNDGVIRLAPGQEVTTDLDGQRVLLSMRKSEELRGVVFTHYRPGSDPDTGKRLSIEQKDDAEIIKDTWRSRLEGFAACAAITHVFVFISEGWQALLKINGPTKTYRELNKDKQLVAILKDAALEAGCTNLRVVPIVFEHLVHVLSALERRSGEDIRRLLLGAGKTSTYDSPKIVEAFLRIAGRHTGSPLFRIDEDVDVSDTSFRMLLDAFAAIEKPNAIYVFSGGYGGWDFAADQQRALRNNYAVRTFHLARKQRDEWLVDPEKCGRFLKSVSELGANQAFASSSSGGDGEEAQVISGAGLSLSYEAIRRLPPFANVKRLITWIDDHLKRKMHEALEDLGENVKPSRVVGALFRQDRIEGEPSFEQASEYLRRLSRGCVFDALIHHNGAPGVYTDGIRGYLSGRFEMPEVFEYEDEGQRDQKAVDLKLTRFGIKLIEAGNDRIERLRGEWPDVLSNESLPGSDGAFGEAFIRENLSPAIVRDRVVTNRQSNLVCQVVADADRYLVLLKVWPIVVGLIEGISDGGDWLFDRLDW